MNERIRELLEQAGVKFVVMPKETEYEQFALLIVRECMACSTWVGKMNTNLVEPVHTAHAVNQRIKQHFGVEE